MKLVRIYVSQDNRRWSEDIPYGPHIDRIADLEITGATIYHASLLSATPNRRKLSPTARLKQRP